MLRPGPGRYRVVARPGSLPCRSAARLRLGSLLCCHDDSPWPTEVGQRLTCWFTSPASQRLPQTWSRLLLCHACGPAGSAGCCCITPVARPGLLPCSDPARDCSPPLLRSLPCCGPSLVATAVPVLRPGLSRCRVAARPAGGSLPCCGSAGSLPCCCTARCHVVARPGSGAAVL
jgi:hypothetical protein